MARPKVAVIGGGLAGFAAAAFVQRAGCEALIVVKAHGATSFCSGALDVAGDDRPAPDRFEAADRSVLANLERVLIERPDHPYALISREWDPPGRRLLALIRDAAETLFPQGGLVELEGELQTNRPCLTALGTAKLAPLYPTGAAVLGAPGLERPLALGIKGLIDFEPTAWGKVAKDVAARLGLALEPAAVWIDLGAGPDLQAPEIARAIDQHRDPFVAAVAEAARRQPAAAIVLPPVLPAHGRPELLRRLAEAAGAPAYELLSLPPSVPGLRLLEHLHERARALDLAVVRGEVTGFAAEAGQIRSITVATNGALSRLEAEAFVLATGKFIGGGLEKKRAFAETVFGLPVFIRGELAGEVFIEKTLGRRVSDPHDLFEAGVRIDRKTRPLGPDGQPVFTNLFAAGQIVAGANYIAHADGAGLALATGAVAGTRAAELLEDF